MGGGSKRISLRPYELGLFGVVLSHRQGVKKNNRNWNRLGMLALHFGVCIAGMEHSQPTSDATDVTRHSISPWRGSIRGLRSRRIACSFVTFCFKSNSLTIWTKWRSVVVVDVGGPRCPWIREADAQSLTKSSQIIRKTEALSSIKFREAETLFPMDCKGGKTYHANMQQSDRIVYGPPVGAKGMSANIFEGDINGLMCELRCRR